MRGLTPFEPRPISQFMLNRKLIRAFINSVNWATARNIDILLNGKVTNSQTLRVELGDMVNDIKNPDLKLKCLHNSIGRAVYAMHRYHKNYVAEGNHFIHDCRLRDCLAKYVHNHGNGYLALMHLKPPADATTERLDNTNLYFEMDNGYQNADALADKIRTHYSKDGAYQVIFFMADREGKPHLEKARLDKLFEIVIKTLPKKKGRVLGACYSQYLLDGKLYNWKDEFKPTA